MALCQSPAHKYNGLSSLMAATGCVNKYNDRLPVACVFNFFEVGGENENNN